MLLSEPVRCVLIQSLGRSIPPRVPRQTFFGLLTSPRLFCDVVTAAMRSLITARDPAGGK